MLAVPTSVLMYSPTYLVSTSKKGHIKSVLLIRGAYSANVLLRPPYRLVF